MEVILKEHKGKNILDYQKIVKRVKALVPEKGMVSILQITDKQYSNIINIWGKIEEKKRQSPIQLEFF